MKMTCSWNPFPYEWFRTKIRFDTEANYNSEMVCWLLSKQYYVDILILGIYNTGKKLEPTFS